MLCKAEQPKKSNLLGPNDTELCLIEALGKTRNCNSLFHYMAESSGNLYASRESNQGSYAECGCEAA